MPRTRKSQMDAHIEERDGNGDGKAPDATPAIVKPYYRQCDAPTQAFVDGIVKRFHKPLSDANVKIDLWFWDDPEGAPSVKVRGFEVFGKIITIPPHNRAAGSPDFRIVVDAFKWESADVAEREAALDSLIEQKEVCTTEKGEVLRDKAGRPKLKNRKPDLIVEGYARVAEEHGAASIEAKQYATVYGTFAQMKLFDDVQGLQTMG